MRILSRLLVVAMVTASAALTFEQAAQAFPNGDVFVSVGNGLVREYTPSGTLVQTLNTGTGSGIFTTGMAFDSFGSLYVTDFNANAVTVFSPAGLNMGSFGSGYNANPESILFDSLGNVYVGQADGSHKILSFDSSGTPNGSFSPALENRGTDWIDLATNQCTMRYTSEGHSVKTFNVCTNTQGSNFANGLPGSIAYAHRILTGGGELVADTQEIVQLDAGGSVIHTYDAPGDNQWFALNLDPDGTSFWSASFDTGDVYRFDIASGAVISHFNTGTGPNTVFGLTVRGEHTAATYSIDLEPKTATNQVGKTHTLQAHLTRGSIDQVGKTVHFEVTGANSASGDRITDGSGVATFSYTGTVAGSDTITASFDANSDGTPEATDAASKTWVKADTTLTVEPGTSDFNDPGTVSATLTSNRGPEPGQTIDFTMGAETCSGVTDASGKASCSITPSEAAGTYPLNASFAGSSQLNPSTGSSTYVVTLEETAIHYTGDTLIANGGTANLSAKLLEDDVSPIAGRNVVLTLGIGASAQSCAAVTNGSGDASCPIAGVNQPLGPGVVSARFAGDAFYLPASDSADTLIFALGPGAFVIGDRKAAVGSAVTFWGAQWWKLNSLSGGTAPASFKGFAQNPNTPACGTGWNIGPGNSPPPPATVPSFMAVTVSSSITRSGSSISGDTLHLVVVQTNPGYAPSPGHPGTGTVVATIC